MEYWLELWPHGQGVMRWSPDWDIVVLVTLGKVTFSNLHATCLVKVTDLTGQDGKCRLIVVPM
jgi:hypothetical protein